MIGTQRHGVSAGPRCGVNESDKARGVPDTTVPVRAQTVKLYSDAPAPSTADETGRSDAPPWRDRKRDDPVAKMELVIAKFSDAGKQKAISNALGGNIAFLATFQLEISSRCVFVACDRYRLARIRSHKGGLNGLTVDCRDALAAFGEL
jgi:hypothetical protein